MQGGNQRPVTSDGQGKGFFSGQGQGQPPGRPGFGQPVPLVSQSMGLQKMTSVENGRLSNQNAPMEQARVRAHSPLKVKQKFEHTATANSLLNSAPQAGQPRRPMSQLPSHNRGYGGWNETGSISNYDRKGLSPNLGGSKAFGQPRLDKEQLREQITTRNRNVKELTVNKRFFEGNLEKRVAEFKERIRSELKSRIFDKVLKSNLHYIYKHYENLKSNVDRQEASRVLNSNVTKQSKEIQEAREASASLEQGNRGLEQRLLESANKVGLIKATPELVENIKKEDVEAKIRELGTENAELERNLAELKKWKDKQLYDLKFKHEIKGRRAMEEKAIRLALQYVDPQDPEQTALKHQVEVLLKEIDLKNQSRKSNHLYQLQRKKEQLERELRLLRFSKP